jgi:hypothetical protein
MNKALSAAAAVVVVIIVFLVWNGTGGSGPRLLGDAGPALTSGSAAEYGSGGADTQGAEEPLAPAAVSLSEGDDPDEIVVLDPVLTDDRILGEAFVTALASLVKNELESGLGWRPNDLFLLGPGWWTDNINNKQLGKLEVARQSCRILKTRMARSNDADAFDPRIEKAESAFFNDATRYMLPSAEKKYREGVKALEAYRSALEEGDAVFHARSNNLYDLLGYYKDVLGSCQSTLVRQREVDGSGVSTFRADDYFYYARGVAEAVGTMGRALSADFREELEARNLMTLMNQALVSLEAAGTLEPWVVTNGAPDGVLANHRLNLSGYLADARQKLHSVRETLRK